jgi:hypothetical protein
LPDKDIVLTIHSLGPPGRRVTHRNLIAEFMQLAAVLGRWSGNQPKEFAMKRPTKRPMKRHTRFASAAAVAAALAMYGPAALAAEPSPATDPGFVPQTGQINPGHAPAPWSATQNLPQDRQPPQDQARAALMTPDPVGVSALGQGGAPGENGTQTTGTGSATAAAAPSGPIGATVQTMPAKFSQRNDLLDHLPMMAWPLRLDAQQRQQIYQAVMADKSQPAPNVESLKPASSLSFEQSGDMHPLPQSLAGIDGLQGLSYVKAKDKVLLVRPANRVVVDEIAM